MQIIIKTLNGSKRPFNFDAEDTVLQVKEALQEKEGIDVKQIRLIHGGKQLSDELKLSDYNVKAGATLHMVLQLRGGGVC
uniref:Ubiquitin-like domain-containing protein n=1 Tax=Chromera velia CCMP2878 TaxID=1169474 RepID=A0A0G4HX10_9ALVE|mmetsp:Transcript_29025/g.56834  ORF Transcript_29025/g.56834 Transcript_29025/m.56834 type:complete len:80 (-) Transcript_29025:463-702(-)|eukprot:Cvel_32965.t1-p1 / transcript=Cvel_32965.t1 / gene=Cvel_32965 / organism=Chromera_velia_CCMP2878 / gene_product=Ubiquitin-60S ribosomal protein L40, putative / transcript_product=Ubiquitin-60S ribosomal protein L40, putative / location=Cvel_scaffold5235:887-1236(-) / protein_length=79 / sequence_SO=supercontig / SO=protein_coding / is_pseudo=false